MDFVQSLDPVKLAQVETALSFVTAPFDAPSYNFPLFLFGHFALENAEAQQSLQTFTGLLFASGIFDIIWMSTNHQHGFIRFLTIVILIFKVPTLLAFGLALRQRGASIGGLGNFRGGDLSGPTVWSMPGGFTSSAREGYQTVDDEPQTPVQPPPQRSYGNAAAPPASQPPPQQPYQSV